MTTQPSTVGSVLVRREGRLGIVTLNDPARMNALGRAMRARLTQCLAELNEDPACRAIVLTGAGEHFTAGGDLDGFKEASIAECRARLRTGPGPLLREMVAGPKPIVAAVEGYAYGAGMSLAAACDHVVASRATRWRCAFTRVGLVPDLGLLFTLPQRVGAARARRLILQANEIDAEEALRIGLVDELAAPAEALATACRIAERYADGPPLAIEFVKHALSLGLEDQLRAEIDLQPAAMMSEDFREGIRAFREKRPPRFAGR